MLSVRDALDARQERILGAGQAGVLDQLLCHGVRVLEQGHGVGQLGEGRQVLGRHIAGLGREGHHGVGHIRELAAHGRIGLGLVGQAVEDHLAERSLLGRGSALQVLLDDAVLRRRGSVTHRLLGGAQPLARSFTALGEGALAEVDQILHRLRDLLLTALCDEGASHERLVVGVGVVAAHVRHALLDLSRGGRVVQQFVGVARGARHTLFIVTSDVGLGLFERGTLERRVGLARQVGRSLLVDVAAEHLAQELARVRRRVHSLGHAIEGVRDDVLGLAGHVLRLAARSGNVVAEAILHCRAEASHLIQHRIGRAGAATARVFGQVHHATSLVTALERVLDLGHLGLRSLVQNRLRCVRRTTRGARHGTAGECAGRHSVGNVPRVQLLVRVDVLLGAVAYELLRPFGETFCDYFAADMTQKRSSGFSKERATKASRNNGFKSSIDTPLGRRGQITVLGRSFHLLRVLVLVQRSLAALHLVRRHHGAAERSGLAGQTTAASQCSSRDRGGHAHRALTDGPSSEVTNVADRVDVAQRRHARRVHAGVAHRLQSTVA